MGEALKLTGLWIFCALLFNVAVGFAYEYDAFNLLSETPDHTITDGWDAALKYLTGYLIEKALSLDNIFVMAMLFTYFKIPGKYQHEVLFWGIIGALIFRGIMIVLGAALVNRFAWIMYVFGALLVVSAFKMLFGKIMRIILKHGGQGALVFQLSMLPCVNSMKRVGCTTA